MQDWTTVLAFQVDDVAVVAAHLRPVRGSVDSQWPTEGGTGRRRVESSEFHDGRKGRRSARVGWRGTNQGHHLQGCHGEQGGRASVSHRRQEAPFQGRAGRGKQRDQEESERRWSEREPSWKTPQSLGFKQSIKKMFCFLSTAVLISSTRIGEKKSKKTVCEHNWRDVKLQSDF